MKMKIRLIQVVLLLIVIDLAASAQKRERQVVMLDDGTRIVGTILADSSGYLMVKISRPQVVTLSKSRVLSLTDLKKADMISMTDKKGYSIRLSASILSGHNDDGRVGTYSFHLSNGYQFKNGLSAGLGTGIEELDVVMIPVYTDLRYQPLKTRLSPFIWAKTGYSFPLGDQAGDDYYYYDYYPEPKGGFMLGIGTGIALYSWQRNAVSIGVGYRYQKIIFGEKDIWGGLKSELVTRFNRIEVQFGFIFR